MAFLALMENDVNYKRRINGTDGV